MPLLPASSSVRVQWKNGLASTLVVASDASAVGDASAAGDDWSWRLSIADVPSRSEFSTFPGVERSIAILHGDALILERAGVRTAVTREGIALVFAGEEFVVGDPIGTDVRDVNWMVRRDRWRGEMQLIRARETKVDAPLVVVHAGVGGVEILSCDEAIGAQLACGETLVTRDRVHLRVAEGCCAIVCTAHPRATEQSASNPPTLRDVVRAFGYIGIHSFGGPTAQIAVMHRVLVEEKRWISNERFLHALSYCMLLPGPEAMQLATYIGWLLQRTMGGVVAGVLFVLPGFLSILALSLAYTAFSEVPAVQGMLSGLKAAVVAIIAQAMVRIGTRVLKSRVMHLIALISFVALFFFNTPFPIVIVAAAAAGVIIARVAPPRLDPTVAIEREETRAHDHTRPSFARTMGAAAIWISLWLAPVAALTWWLGADNIFAAQAWFFSKAAVVTFGGAYSVLTYIAQQAVEVHRWVTAGEMLTGLGMAETTPGPLIQVVQFVGYLSAYRTPGALNPVAAGVLASLLVTWVTYLPCFLWIFVGGPYIEYLRSNRALNAALSTIPAAVVGVILSLSLWLALNTLFTTVTQESWHGVRLLVPALNSFDLSALLIALLCAVVIFRFRWTLGRTLALAVALGAVRSLF